MNCIIIEDDYLSQQTILKCCQSFGKEINVLSVFNNVEDAEEYIKKNTIKIDLIFLDIILPGKSGIDFISDLLIMPYIIMTTAYDNYAVNAFDLNVVDYLKKPIVFRRFAQAVEKVKKIIAIDEENGEKETIILKSKGTILKFRTHDIDFIESYSDYIKLFTKKQSFLHLTSLKSIKVKLHVEKFIQIHRRFIVNKDKISYVNNHKVSIIGYPNIELPISRALRKDFYKNFLGDEEMVRENVI